MTLQAKAEESVDVHALRISRAYSRLVAEAERTARPNTNSHEHAFNQALIASFENGLKPELRVEIIIEDASQSFMASKARVRKHEANKLRSAAPLSSTSVSSMYPTSPQLEDRAVRLEQRIADLEAGNSRATQMHASSMQRDRDSGRGGGGDKRPRSRSQQASDQGRDSNKTKSFQSGTKPDARTKKKYVDEACDFIGCRFNNSRFSHKRADCKTQVRVKKDGFKVTQE